MLLDKGILLILIVSVCAQHLPPRNHQEAMIHEVLMKHHGVAAWIQSHEAQAFSHSSNRTMKTLAVGNWQSLRIKANFDRLGDSRFTCQPATPNAKLELLKNAMPPAYGPFDTRDPDAMYTVPTPQYIQLMDRTSSTQTPKATMCKSDWVMDDQKIGFVKQIIEEVSLNLASLLSPVVFEAGSTSIAGNKYQGTQLACFNNNYYTWNLASDATFRDVDLVFMVTAEPDWANSFALPCQVASDGRPTILVLNLSPTWLSLMGKPGGLRVLKNRVIHSVFKALGLSADMFSQWKQANPVASIVDTPRGHRVYMMTTKNVKEWVEQKQFLCSGNPRGGSGFIGGAELEDALADGTPKMYWEKRIFRGEIMTMIDFLRDSPDNIDPSQENLVISGLTLAALADTGFFVVNDQLAAPLPWGYNQPCEWATQRCDQWSSRYACLDYPASTSSCTADYTSVGTCNSLIYSSNIPSYFQYKAQTAPFFGGKDKLMDYCPISTPYFSCLKMDYDGTNPDCSKQSCPSFHLKGAGSRCFMSTLRYKPFDTQTPLGLNQPSQGTCLKQQCKYGGADNTQQIIVITIADQTYTCYNKGDVVGPSVSNKNGVATINGDTLLGEITCPDPTEFCSQAGLTAYELSCNPLEDCNGHGVCTDQGTCKCFSECGSDPTNCVKGSKGFFQGPHCEQCMEGFLPPDCVKRACPIDATSGQTCFGHGTCDAVLGTCVCFASDALGYWDTKTGCSSCDTAYTGGACKDSVCVTGGCGRGTCDTTTKRCKCDSSESGGYWAGLKCDKCRPGYDFSSGCRKPYDNTCKSCTPISASSTTTATTLVPDRLPMLDDCFCPLDVISWPTLAAHFQPLQTCTCTEYEELMLDCKGYPLLYDTCFVKDKCGCQPRPRPKCRPSTDRAPSPYAYPFGVIGQTLMITTTSVTDPRSIPTSTVTSPACKCPTTQSPVYDCVGKNTNFDSPEDPTTLVWYEPEQMFFEDFCHCVSPQLPECSPTTKPQLRTQMAQGTQFNCNNMKCPDWTRILNIDKAYSDTLPDLSLVDCDGFPAPQLKSREDPCGCPFPVFKCKPGTQGMCSPTACPKWDVIKINCQGIAPPQVNWHGPHPCGCPPPPPIVCLEGTGPACDCVTPQRKTIQIDCRGTPLKPQEWSPYKVFPKGDPFIQLCDPCPMCPTPPPLVVCIPGSDAPIPKSENPVPSCPNGPISPYPVCPNYPLPCPIDCKGKPPPGPKSYDPACECPPPPQPPCIDGTDGTTGDIGIRVGTCGARPEMCHPYICGDAASSRLLARDGVYSACEYRQKSALEFLGVTTQLYCVQEGSCVSDNDCVCGFKCGPCGICIDKHKVVSGCLADPKICGDYACKPRCDAEGIAKINAGQLVGECVAPGQCVSHSDCQNALCSASVLSKSPLSGAALEAKLRVLGNAPVNSIRKTFVPVPGEDPTAKPAVSSPFDYSTHNYRTKKSGGQCFKPHNPNFGSTQHCFSHNDCGGYACGKDNLQIFFANSRCMSSCAVNAHCHPDYRCEKGSCVATVSEGSGQYTSASTNSPSGGCEDQPSDYCFPYVCGSQRALQPAPKSQCRSSCRDDVHCQPGYVCEFLSTDDLRSEYGQMVQDTMTTLSNKKAYEIDSASSSGPLGFCLPSAAVKRRSQTAAEKEHERALNKFNSASQLYKLPYGSRVPMLVVPVGHINVDIPMSMVKPGYFPLNENDPNTAVLSIAPFDPPYEAPPASGKPMGTSAAGCRPYNGAVRGATTGQSLNLEAAGRAAFSAGFWGTLMECKTSCQTDFDCIGSYYCLRPAKVTQYQTEQGKLVYSEPCDDPMNCHGTKSGSPTSSVMPYGTCQPKRSLGTVCNMDQECSSGYCVRGVCCNTQCSSPCMTCQNMGICGYVYPQTDPDRTCGKCEWCDYQTNSKGKITPKSPLICVAVPMGQNPGQRCGPHGTCNGEGGCMAQPGWGGVQMDTCAPGYTGPNCEDETAFYRIVEVSEKFDTCTVDKILVDSGSISSDARLAKTTAALSHKMESAETMRTYKYRHAHGLQEAVLPSSYILRAHVIDRRPRQFASAVLGVSRHGQTSCSKILGRPVPRGERVHRESPEAWTPSQYYKKPITREEVNPHLKYFPWVNCLKYADDESGCLKEKGCTFKKTDAGYYCTGDGTVVTAAEAEKILSVKTTKKNTQTAEYEYDTTLFAPLPTSWIELEFPEAVVIEGVQIFENFNAGSVVMIEAQPMEFGTTALSSNGGGAPSTNDMTGEDIPGTRQIPPRPLGPQDLAQRCSMLTPRGSTACKANTLCSWDGNRCLIQATTTLTSCPVPQSACSATTGCRWNLTGKFCYRSDTSSNSNSSRKFLARRSRVASTQNAYVDLRAGDHIIEDFTLSVEPQHYSNSTHAHRMMRILDATSTSNGISATALVRPFCQVDYNWSPPYGQFMRTPSYCKVLTQGKCLDGCKWFSGTTIDGNAPLPPTSLSPAEIGHFGDMMPPRPFSLKDAGPEFPVTQAPPTTFDIPPTAGPMSCESIPAGQSINPNKNGFEVIWKRDMPNFLTNNVYRDEVIDVGRPLFRSKVIRITFAPVSPRLTQIDAVAIIGSTIGADEPEPLCGGEIWASPIPEGTPTSARVTQGSVKSVPCSGNGRCGPRGCECFGNFFGKTCNKCKMGWSGVGCDKKKSFGCQKAFYEDLTQLGEAVLSRWKYDNMKNLSSSATPMRYFGSSMYSPVYDLGGQWTHIQINANVLVVDIPPGDDVGFFMSLTKDRSGRDLRVVKVEKPTFFSGLNLIGTENGDYQGDVTARVKWPHQSAMVNLTLWWGGQNTGDFALSLTSLEIEVCNFPDLGD
eukprot:PhF_6_TR1955/c0_g1_i1/m.3162